MNSDVRIERGFSRAAVFIERETRDSRRFLHKSCALGIERVLRADLADAWEECREPNWDGHGALPVIQEALRYMYVFLEALPPGLPHPTIAADPNGHLSAEWYRNRRRVLSVSVTPDGYVHYAALLGPDRACGTETFWGGEVPQAVLDLVRRVYS